MKDIFSGFYTLNDENEKEIFESESTIFIFDTSSLLNLYSYTEETRNDFFKVLDTLKDKLWIPYHVGLEYQLQRLTVIKNEKANYSKLRKHLSDIKNIFNNDIEKLNFKKRTEKLNDLIGDLSNNINQLLDKFEKDIMEFDDKQPCVRSTDIIRKKLDDYFEERVGIKPTQDKLDSIYEEGNERYNKKIPPGYMDEKEKKDKPNITFDKLDYIPKYGDLVIWKQILEKVKDTNIKNVFFISDDLKEDWIFKINSGGEKDIGVRAELRQEIQNLSDIEIFEIYDSSLFIQKINDSLLVEGINEKSIAEIIEFNEYQLNNVNIYDFLEKYKVDNPTYNDSLESNWKNAFKNNNLTQKNEDSEIAKMLDKNYEASFKKENKALAKTIAEDYVISLKKEQLSKEIEQIHSLFSIALKNEDEDDMNFYSQLILKKISELDELKKP